MRKLISFLLVVFTVLQSMPSFAINDYDRQELVYKNLFADLNPGFESGIARWQGSPGLVKVTSGTNLLIGKGSATWDSTSAAQVMTSPSFSMPYGYQGQNCEVSLTTMVPSGTATHLLKVQADTDFPVSQTIISSTLPTQNIAIFPCPAGTATVKVSLVSVASNEPLIVLDDLYLGRARTVGAAQLVTEWTAFTPTGSWTTNTTYTGFYRRVGDSEEYDIKIALSGAPNSATLTVNTRGSNVIDTSKLSYPSIDRSVYGTASILKSGIGNPVGIVVYNSNTAIQVETFALDTLSTGYVRQAGTVTQSSPVTFASGDTLHLHFSVPIVGFRASTALSPDQQGVSWSGYHDATCDFVQNSSTMSDPAADATCNFVERTNRNFGTVTSLLSSGSPLPGIVFTPKSSGRFFVCAGFNYYAPAVSNASAGFQLTDGTNIIDDGFTQAVSTAQEVKRDRLCGIVTASQGVSKTIKIQTSTTSTGLNLPYGAGVGSAVEWSIFNIDAVTPAILANSVSTGNANGERLERASVTSICSSSPCTIARSSGSWLTSITRTSTGIYVMNIAAGIFSATPSCWFSPGGAGIMTQVDYASGTRSATTFGFNSNRTDTFSLVDILFDVQCMGPR